MKVVAALAFFIGVALTTTSAQNTAGYKKVCYFANWPYYRQGHGSYWVDKLDPFECTHLMYGFAVLDPTTYEMKVYDPYIDIDLEGYKQFNDLRNENPNLKTLIALGGWNDAQINTPLKYSELVSDPAKRKNFVEKALAFVIKYNFSGLDFDWEYPGDPSGKESDKANFVLLLQELRDAFHPKDLLVTLAVSCSITRAKLSYDIPGIAGAVDFINLMNYDIHGAFEDKIDHHAPLYRRDTDGPDDTVISESIDYWLDQGAPKEKLIFGIPYYGRSFRLANPTLTTIKSPHQGAGAMGPYTQEDGSLALYEICQKQQEGWTVVTDPKNVIGPYAFDNQTWVGWDDVDQVIIKVKYAMEKKLGGVMIWDLSLDDFNGCCGMGERPASKAIDATLQGKPFDTSITTPLPTTCTIVEPIKCTSNSEVFFADPADCSKYYRCVNGRVVTLYCGDDLAFNSATNACEWPENVPGCNY